MFSALFEYLWPGPLLSLAEFDERLTNLQAFNRTAQEPRKSSVYAHILHLRLTFL
jgi:hypothetical protein